MALRKSSRSEPFQFIGLDYLGPINVKESESAEKIWVCLFTCLSIHAVHLELAKVLSTQMFLDCLRRFILRIRRPRTIICKNAPQFRLLESTLNLQWSELLKSDELQEFRNHRVEF